MRPDSWRIFKDGATQRPGRPGIGPPLSGALGARRRGGRKWLAAAIAMLTTSACTPPGPPNLLLIVSDTLRADALSCYGGRAQAPNICGLAERGVLFENAYSNGPWTLPSTVSIFTSHYASAHGRDPEDPAEKHFYFVPDEKELFAEQLRERGYRTRAFIGNRVAHRPNALQGFDVTILHETPEPDRHHAGERLGLDLSVRRDRRVLHILNALLDDDPTPFFFVQWMMDPHAIYSPPPRFASRVSVDRSKLTKPLVFYSRLEAQGDASRNTGNLNAYVGSFNDTEHEALRELYRREIESVDARVGTLLEGLRERNLLDRTTVIFTSDHGEGFGEHGKFLHAGRWLYQEFVRIPMIVAGPGIRAGVRVPGAVSQIDLVPTLRELFDEPASASASAREQGVSFAATLRSGASLDDGRYAYVVDRAAAGIHDALVAGRYKLMGFPDRFELYDLEADPGERRDLADAAPAIRRELTEKITRLRDENERRRVANLAFGSSETLERTSAETLEQLRALGYVEPGPTSKGADAAPPPRESGRK